MTRHVPIFALILLTASAKLPSQQPATVGRGLRDRYCVVCHSQKAKAAGLESSLRLTLDTVDLAHVEKDAETWEKVPIGFSLENFDGIGQWRTMDGSSPVDASGRLVDGTKMEGVTGLRQALLRYSPQFVRVVTEKLLIYALGRGTEYFDMPLIRSIVHNAEPNRYRFSSLVLGVVKSEPFQMNQKVQAGENPPAGDN